MKRVPSRLGPDLAAAVAANGVARAAAVAAVDVAAAVVADAVAAADSAGRKEEFRTWQKFEF
jgi:hydroxymethylpyrimidine/phosphomethylpyrimidine kinase